MTASHQSLLLLALTVATSASAKGFVKSVGATFSDDDGVFRYAGTNVYYGHYSPPFMTDDVFARAKAQNFSVVRVWAFFEKGQNNAPAFQYYDAATMSVVVNTTALARMDYLVMRAASLGLRLVLTLTNNWGDFGGMDAYGAWRKQQDPTYGTWYHDDFYDDAIVRGWYQAFVKALVTRTNTLTGIPYASDPTIFAWQLANEPRCVGTAPITTSKKCVTTPAGG